jgi:hypothetical protein
VPTGPADDTESEDALVEFPPELDAELQIDPDEPIAPPTEQENLPFAVDQPHARLSTEQARAVIQQHLRTLLEQGQTHTQPKDIGEMKPRTTRTREWVRQEMIRLCTEAGPGEIGMEREEADPPGVYRIVARATAGV